MDDRRFDALTRALGQGGSRRALLKGLLGLGGVTAAGAVLHDTEAARRGFSGPALPTGTVPPTQPPAPTATVVRPCPSNQVPCGTDCCADGVAICCGNECCYGTCYGDGRCCQYPLEFCSVSGECCPDGWTCGGRGCVTEPGP